MKGRVTTLEGDLQLLVSKVCSHGERIEDLSDQAGDLSKQVESHEKKFAHINRIEINVAGISEKTDSAHKRIDQEKAEVDLLRLEKHKHANEITRHGAILESHNGIFLGIKDCLKELTEATKQNTVNNQKNEARSLRIEIMAGAIIFLGTVIAGSATWLVAHLGKLFLWW